MGQAKQRGDFNTRKQEAVDAGRIKDNTPALYHSVPNFRIPGTKGSMFQQLTDQIAKARISSDPGDKVPYHLLSENAERFPADFPDGGTVGSTLYSDPTPNAP